MSTFEEKVFEVFSDQNTPSHEKWCVTIELLRRLRQTMGAIGVIVYDDMLLPTNESAFRREIPRYIWDDLQKHAASLLECEQFQSQFERDHLRSIVNGQPPFGYKVAPNVLFDEWLKDNPDSLLTEAFIKFKDFHPEYNPKAAKKAFGERIVRIYLK